MATKITIYDPPSGWMYGFPKQYKPAYEGEPIEDTLLRDGYPVEIIRGTPELTKYTRFWETELEEEL